MTRFEEKAKAEFQRHAKEELKVREILGTSYAFGSELACLRLLKAYRYCGERADVGYSEPYQSWYFRLEPN